MAHAPEIRSAVRSTYIYQQLSLEAAAERLKVSFGTAARWKREALENGDDWDRARSAALLSSQGAEAVTQAVLEQFVTLFQSTMTGLKEDTKATALSKAEALSRLSDAYNKTMSAVAKGSPKLNKLAVAMEVIEMLSDFVGNQFPQHASVFIDILEPFGECLSQNLS
ncbi:MAG TPA: DNA-binding protein [Methylophilaceae bacterium]|nr:DNA-binding protein [Methylophilaceae bacterium]